MQYLAYRGQHHASGVCLACCVHICNDNQRLTYNESSSNTVTAIYFYPVTSSWKFLHKLKTIPMNLDEVKVRPQVWLIKSLKESDETLQIDDLTINTVQSKPPANTLSLSRHPSMRRQEDKVQRKCILTKQWNYLYPETMYIS